MGLVKGIIIDSKTGEPIKNVKIKVITNTSLYNISPLKIVNKLKKVNIKSIPFTNKKEKSWTVTIPILKENNLILNIVISNSFDINSKQVVIKTQNIINPQNRSHTLKPFETMWLSNI